MGEFCNSISKTGTHSCELPKGHEGKRCQAESFRGGYVFWEKPAEPEPLAADWLSQFGPRDVKPRRSETIILEWPEPEQKPEPYDGIMWGDE